MDLLFQPRSRCCEYRCDMVFAFFFLLDMGPSRLKRCTPHRTEDIPLLHDPSRCLEDHGHWDVITMISDLANVSPDAAYVGGAVEDILGNKMK